MYVWRYNLGHFFSERRLRYRIRRANITPGCVSITFSECRLAISHRGEYVNVLWKCAELYRSPICDIASGRSVKTFYKTWCRADSRLPISRRIGEKVCAFLCVHWLLPMADSDIASGRTKVTSDLAISFSDLNKNCLLFVQKGFYSQIHLIIIPFSNKFINAN